ncbi:MAG: hypothetical protein H7X94_02700 [Vallitaleaceae bacterium]|nr:hypothetical protein [Vallitaleaceae bacterium]
MNRKRKIRSVFVQILVAALVLTSFNGSVKAVGEQPTVTLTREDAAVMAVSNSSVVRGLSNGLEDMKSGYEDMRDGLKGLYGLYEVQLPRYKSLSAKNAVTQGNVNYKTYSDLSLDKAVKDNRRIVVIATLATLNAIPVVDQTADQQAQIVTLTNEKTQLDIDIPILANSIAAVGLNAAQIAQVITVPEFYELQELAAIFTNMGITSPNLTPEQEYNSFINPLKVAPVSMAKEIDSMSVGLDSETSAIGFGAKQLYDALLMMYGFYDLQVASFTLTEKDYSSAKGKFERGLVSQYDLTKAKNAYDIAVLEKVKMERDMDNTEMTLKNMLGLNLKVKIKLLDSLDTSGKLNTLVYYLQQAGINRNEIKTNKNTIADLENQMDTIQRYFASTSDDYLIVKTNLANGQISLQTAQLSLEKEIRKAYEDVLIKETEMKVKQLEAGSAKNNLNNLQRYLALGFVTENAVTGIKIKFLQAEGAYQTAQRSYYNALSSIQAASSIGPAYSMNGGMSLEK